MYPTYNRQLSMMLSNPNIYSAALPNTDTNTFSMAARTYPSEMNTPTNTGTTPATSTLQPTSSTTIPSTPTLVNTENVQLNPTNDYLGQYGIQYTNSPYNFRKAIDRIKFGISNDWDRNSFMNNGQFNFDAAKESLMNNPMFRDYVATLTPQQQESLFGGLRNGSITFKGQSLESINAQNASLMAQQSANQWTPQHIMDGVKTGISALGSLANIYFMNRQYKLAKEQMAKTEALQRANFKMQARSMNTHYRDQMSGRGTSVMSGNSKRALGRMYANRRIEETY